jgi:hypothetical protein
VFPEASIKKPMSATMPTMADFKLREFTGASMKDRLQESQKTQARLIARYGQFQLNATNYR